MRHATDRISQQYPAVHQMLMEAMKQTQSTHAAMLKELK
jgi:hypothetical protein